MPYVEYITVFFFGTLWGSFFYTLALRFADGSFKKNAFRALTSPSQCAMCGARIHPLSLIPVIGYAVLRGRCRKCGGRISPAYPMMELLYGAVAVLVAWKAGFSAYALIIYCATGVAIAISVIDIKILAIPDPMVILFFLISLYPAIVNPPISDHLYGALGMGVFFIIVLLIFPGSFGGGDVKFATAIGFLMGVELSIVVMEIALITGSIAGITSVIISGKGLRSKLPFAPFLTLGIAAALLYGREIILLYSRILY